MSRTHGVVSRRPEEYPRAFEDSKDAKAIALMLDRYRVRLSTLELAQARGAVEAVIDMVRRGVWLDEKDAIQLHEKLNERMKSNDP